MKTSDTPGVIAPPPLIYLGGLLAAFLIELSWRRINTGLPWEIRLGLAAVLGSAGLSLVVSAINCFHKAKTNARPWLPTTALVTDGVYGFTRNPMYVAMTCFYLTLALLADSLTALALLLPVLLTIRFGVIAREERYLIAKFGDSYREYMQRVARWIPGTAYSTAGRGILG